MCPLSAAALDTDSTFPAKHDHQARQSVAAFTATAVRSSRQQMYGQDRVARRWAVLVAVAAADDRERAFSALFSLFRTFLEEKVKSFFLLTLLN